MILIGHDYIDFKAFEKIDKKEDIEKTSPNSTVVFDFHHDRVSLCHYVAENSVKFAVIVKEEKEVIFASSLGASYIICDKGLATKAQKFADDYLFDAKILLRSENEEDIEYVAKNSIDGILFEKGISYGSR